MDLVKLSFQTALSSLIGSKWAHPSRPLAACHVRADVVLGQLCVLIQIQVEGMDIPDLEFTKGQQQVLSKRSRREQILILS